MSDGVPPLRQLHFRLSPFDFRLSTFPWTRAWQLNAYLNGQPALYRKAAYVCEHLLVRYSRSDGPMTWAHIQLRLGETMASFARHQLGHPDSAAQCLRAAISAFEAMLEVLAAEGDAAMANKVQPRLQQAKNDLEAVQRALRDGKREWAPS